MKLPVKPVILFFSLIILNPEFCFKKTHCESLKASNIFKSLFSLKTNIEIYEDTKLQRTIKTYEKYSLFEKRAVIQLKIIKNSSSSNHDVPISEITYYHDRIYKTWLRYEDQHCLESNFALLAEQMFVDDLFKLLWTQDDDDDDSETETSHIVGAAKLILMLEKVKVDFKKPEFRFVRNIEAAVFKGSLKSQNDAYSDVRYEIIYNKAELVQVSDFNQVIPLHLILNYESLQKTNLIVIHFYGYERINVLDQTDLNESNDLLLFPFASNCGIAINKNIFRNSSENLEKIQKSFSRVSFKAKYNKVDRLDDDYDDDDLMLDDNMEAYFAFNVEAKLMRRDRITHNNFLDSSEVSSTIYDFNQNYKYNTLKIYPNSKTNTPKDEDEHEDKAVLIRKLNNSQEGTSKCIASKISRRSNYNYNQFLKLDELKYLGKSRTRGILSNIFEQDSIVVPPYWLFPTVLVTINNDDHNQTIETSEFDQIVGPTGYLILLYHFTSSLSTDEMPIEKLLKIEIMVKDNLRKSLTRVREIHVFNFHQLDSPLSSNLISDFNEATNTFSLPENCIFNSGSKQSKMYADLAVLFEPKGHLYLDREELVLSADRLFQRTVRNELLLQAFYSNFQLSRIYIDRLETKLARSKSDPKNLIANRWPIPILKLYMRVNNFDITNIDCFLLGRGRFLDQSRVFKAKVFTFEDCFWFAYHHSKAICKDVVFAYSQTTKSHINECLIDPLHSPNSRTSLFQTLNYYPYKFGEHMMYRIHETTHSGEKSKDKTNGDTQFTSWPIVRSAVNYLVGQQIVLPKIDQENDLELVYLVKQVELSGELYTKEELLESGKCLEGIGWIEKQLNNYSTYISSRPLIKTIKPPAITTLNNQDTAIMTKSLCQSMCLLDSECKSYSFCKHVGSKQALCTLSSIDIEKEDVSNSLKTILKSGERSSQSVSIKEATGALEGTVEVRLDKRCFTTSKSYSDLFRKDSHQVSINLNGNSNVIQVSGRNECARLCYEQNLNFTRGVIKQELDAKTILEQSKTIQNSNVLDNSSDILERIDFALNWYSRNVKSLCTTFHYADSMPTGNGSSASSACIFSKNQQKDDTTMSSGSSQQQMTKITTMSRYKLIETSFYEKMTGFRLLDLPEEEEEMMIRTNNSSIHRYLHLLMYHHQGFNRQILLNMDNLEFCARACISQTHGPKPSCTSFDLVHEQINSTTRKYCLLNSQSLYSLKRSKNVERQVLYAEKNFQYWHYEPRESLIIPSNMDDDDKLIQILKGDSLIKQFEQVNYCKLPSASLIDFKFLLVALFGIILGLVSGIKLTERALRHKAEDETEFKYRMFRLVHRVSGLSINDNYLQNEVRM